MPSLAAAVRRTAFLSSIPILKESLHQCSLCEAIENRSLSRHSLGGPAGRRHTDQ